MYTQNMLDWLNLDDGTVPVPSSRLFQKLVKQLQTYDAKQPRRAETPAQNVKHYPFNPLTLKNLN